MKKSTKYIIIGLVVALLVLGYMYLTKEKEKVDQVDATAMPNVCQDPCERKIGSWFSNIWMILRSRKCTKCLQENNIIA